MSKTWTHGTDSLQAGLTAIGMPSHRHQHAIKAVKTIIAANVDAPANFRWYKVRHTNEIAATWYEHDRNVLWITPANVKVIPTVVFPLTVTSFLGTDDDHPAHHFPGAEPGTGNRTSSKAPLPLPCQSCWNRHGINEDCY